ncbi:MAG TPA: hypothetical protein VK420_16680 [Longimicrobium sp.]|nr:hypothetical protein [Longimicrobium sp.]
MMTNPFPKVMAVLALTAAAACARTATLSAPSGAPYARGPVEAFTHRATASNLLVRGGPGSPEACGISATVDARTRYYQREGSGELRGIPRSAVTVGDTVEVYVEGPVAESCPPQGYGAAVIRVARP